MGRVGEGQGILMDIQTLIIESMNRAVENGYKEFTMHETPAAIAVDMVDYDSDIAKLVENEFAGDEVGLIPFIEAWQRSKAD